MCIYAFIYERKIKQAMHINVGGGTRFIWAMLYSFLSNSTYVPFSFLHKSQISWTTVHLYGILNKILYKHVCNVQGLLRITFRFDAFTTVKLGRFRCQVLFYSAINVNVYTCVYELIVNIYIHICNSFPFSNHSFGYIFSQTEHTNLNQL